MEAGTKALVIRLPWHICDFGVANTQGDVAFGCQRHAVEPLTRTGIVEVVIRLVSIVAGTLTTEHICLPSS